MSELLENARWFWYQNVPGVFDLDGKAITRAEIQTYGGPDPALDDCVICQRSEWLSRVRQRDMFELHECSLAVECKKQCRVQGDEDWVHRHQNFWFSGGCDEELSTPRCLCLFRSDGKARLYPRYFSRTGDSWMAVLRRQLAQTCQVDVVQSVDSVDWSKYDLFLFMNTGDDLAFKRPPVPILMYVHDCWIGAFQKVIDRFMPECIFTPNPTMLTSNYKINDGAGVFFYPVAPSMFFSRPNLGEKQIGLLAAGSLNSHLYEPRRQLDKQLKQLPGKFTVGFTHTHGAQRNWRGGRTQDKELRFLNRWSERLGSAKFVTFASFSDKRFQPVFMKHYECLASGAVPILPDSPDLFRLGIKPMVHYIPLAKVWGDNKALASILLHYEDYRLIAVNAVQWARVNMDRMLFDGFEDMIQEVTGNRYPRRVFE